MNGCCGCATEMERSAASLLLNLLIYLSNLIYILFCSWVHLSDISVDSVGSGGGTHACAPSPPKKTLSLGAESLVSLCINIDVSTIKAQIGE